jgi:hypothetical protein
MNCQDFRELIDSYLCDELLTETNHGVLRHLENCANCRGVIEDRRVFRARLRSTVLNCEELTICEKFNANLHNSLRQSAFPEERVARSVFSGGFAFAAVAASFLIAAAFGIWFFQSSNVTPLVASSDENLQPAHFHKIALGDHQNCAVNHRLEEKPVEIDLSSPQFASLKENVIEPLEKELETCKFIESHICKFEGQTFTHLVFDNEGRTMSVLIGDIGNYKALEANYIAKLSDQGYQIAHFDIDRKAVFVISDLPEQKNSIAAELLETPLRRQFSDNRQAALIPFVQKINF